MRIEDIIGENICVKCSTKKEYILFLKAAEKAGMKWASGECPTQHYEYWRNEPIYIRYNGGKVAYGGLVRTSSNITDYTVVKFSDLDLPGCIKKKYQLEIKQKNRSVIATLYDDKGAFVKYAKAKCSLEDEFNFETGKKIALQRLFEIEPEKEKENSYKMELKSDLTYYGIVGEPTEVEAFGNVKLYIGDVVELFDSKGESRGLKCVCKDPFSLRGRGFVMGVSSENFRNGQSSVRNGNWLIVKRKSYTEMNAGDVIGVIEYTLI